MIVRGVKIRSEGNRLNGCLFSPDYARRHPAALLLPGFPGVQKHEELALSLVERGMACLLVHYRGTWGSEGKFTIEGLLADALAGLKLLRRYPHVDPAQTAVLGVSVGGWTALRLAASEKVAAAAAIAPLVPRTDAPGDQLYLMKNVKMIRSAGPRALWDEYLHAARVDFPEEYMSQIHPAPVLLVHAMKDELVPRKSVWKLWECAREPKDLLELDGVGHDLAERRRETLAHIADWTVLAAKDGLPQAAAQRPIAVHGHHHWAH